MSKYHFCGDFLLVAAQCTHHQKSSNRLNRIMFKLCAFISSKNTLIHSSWQMQWDRQILNERGFSAVHLTFMVSRREIVRIEKMKKKMYSLFEYFQSHFYTYARFYDSRRHVCFFFFYLFSTFDTFWWWCVCANERDRVTGDALVAVANGQHFCCCLSCVSWRWKSRNVLPFIVCWHTRILRPANG